MATLVMVESWLHSTGQCLPPLIRDLGHDYVLLTKDPSLYPPSADGAQHPVIAHADEVVRVDTNDPRAAIAAALEVNGRRPVAGVLTTCDYYLATAAQLAAALGLAGASPSVMHTATHNHLVRAALDDTGLANPAFAVADTWQACRDAAANIGYPLVAKPVDLNSGTAVRRIDDETALFDAFTAITGARRNTRGQRLCRLVLLEELLHGQELSVEAATRDGHTTIMGITDKSVTGSPAFVESGHMFPARLPDNTAAEVRTFVGDALAAIGYTHGLSHTEVILTSDGPRVVEINPRQAGGYIFDLIRLVTGTHPLELLVRLSLGETPRIGTAEAPVSDVVPTAASAAIFFVMSPESGHLRLVDGTDALDSDPLVVRWTLPVPTVAQTLSSNDAYLGHVVTVDPHGSRAREHAETAVGSLRLHLAAGVSHRPVGVPSGLCETALVTA
jgi:biotin carboxylase